MCVQEDTVVNQIFNNNQIVRDAVIGKEKVVKDFLYVCMSLCLYVCMSVCLYVCMSICLYVCMSVCLHHCWI